MFFRKQTSLVKKLRALSKEVGLEELGKNLVMAKSQIKNVTENILTLTEAATRRGEACLEIFLSDMTNQQDFNDRFLLKWFLRSLRNSKQFSSLQRVCIDNGLKVKLSLHWKFLRQDVYWWRTCKLYNYVLTISW